MNDQPVARISDPFSQMASRIDRNAEESFGGAFVIVPPAGAGEPMSALMLSSTDPVQFYMLLQAQITKTLDELKNPQPYGRAR